MNKRQKKNLREAEDNSEWLEYLNKCDDMLMDEDYEWAADTLQGIRDWIQDNKHVTDKQKEAISNIEEAGERD